MIKNNHYIDFKSEHKSLSILLNSGGFSFCISDVTTQKEISFVKYTFEKKIDVPEFLLTKILQIFADDKELQQDFESINVVHQNNLSTLVPTPFFDENKLKKYLDFNIKTLPNDYITHDEISDINTMNVYIPYVNINNYLLQNFGEFEFKHHSTILIEKLSKYIKDNSLEQGYFVYVSENQLDIVIFKSSKLIFYNSFEFETPQDFIYYILFVTEQLELDTNKFELTFLGNINKGDDNYKITYNYIRNVNFIKTKSDFFNSSNKFLNHSNYILVS